MDTWLLSRMQELRDLQGLIGLATWDQETYLPAKAGPARAHQLSTLQGLHHERLVDPRLGEALARAASQDLTGDARAMVRVLSREREREVRVPSDLVKALAEAQSKALHAWREARKERRFALFQPALQRLLELRREQADAYGHGGERYDALLEGHEPGMRVERLTPVLSALREHLIPMVGKLVGARRPVARLFDGRRYDKDAQWAFTLRLLQDIGFDLEAGRQDVSIHPFTGGTHPLDVRLTTHVDETSPLSAIFSTIHEAGHGLYEQGFSPAHYRTPLASAPSMGLHESQSRLWENIVGRSRPFWEHYFPALRAAFPEALAAVDLDDFHLAVNEVSPSLIRIESDEVTYNLHIALRYELELLLVRDELPLADLPAAWNARMEKYLGVTPPDDTRGVLQDIHWAWGELGYFPTYSLGNLYAASLYRAAERALPDLAGHLRRGELLPLRDWLRTHIHSQGFRLPAEELVRGVTGHGLTDTDFLAYLKSKYGALYGVSL
ncbi:carboxypeptidase M32 [Pyxidicoccus fallax]|uniref:Metal-dependent carboxypeptidase n=1 Tax=Pyxidicoccus fallax TaxID=394095 RepID=A0A848LQT1_9BACT|nr:carboxypeptidase M32 [Pyxidicoccus fallax]NMO20268.1 carboxypeptidase M32 [Pyxidicoccus fallax]NPC84534.1 carboxypeptidase M32 [Pyxidicoccus fallax]